MPPDRPPLYVWVESSSGERRARVDYCPGETGWIAHEHGEQLGGIVARVCNIPAIAADLNIDDIVRLDEAGRIAAVLYRRYPMLSVFFYDTTDPARWSRICAAVRAAGAQIEGWRAGHCAIAHTPGMLRPQLLRQEELRVTAVHRVAWRGPRA